MSFRTKKNFYLNKNMDLLNHNGYYGVYTTSLFNIKITNLDLDDNIDGIYVSGPIQSYQLDNHGNLKGCSR